MKKKISLGDFIETYSDGKGGNPILASLGLLTFAKRIPLQVIKGMITGLFFFVLIVILLYVAEVETWLQVIGFIGGLLLLIFMCIAAILKFISGAFLEEVSDVILGIVSPIDASFDLWKGKSGENISRKDFTMKVLRMVILPKIFGIIGRLLFKKRLDKGIQHAIDHVEEEEILDTDQSYLDKLIQSFTNGVDQSKRYLSAPFRLSLKLTLGFFFLLIFLHLAINWEAFFS